MRFNRIVSGLMLVGVSLFFLRAVAFGVELNVKDFGALGNGKADDTVAIQKAIDAAASRQSGGELLIPAGNYHITRTLRIEKSTGLIIRGQGSSYWRLQTVYGHQGKNSSTTLYWCGKPGGVMFEIIGSGGGSVFKDMTLVGDDPRKNKTEAVSFKDTAGILLLFHTIPGWGTMNWHLSNLSFERAKVGIQMATSKDEGNSSDIFFEKIYFKQLDTGFLVKNVQGVNYLFNFIFALDVNTVLHFERGGDVEVNDAQMTNSGFVQIDEGGGNSGVYLFNYIRSEARHGGRFRRYQLLNTANNHGALIMVHFNSFDDAQWQWYRNKTAQKNVPLCDIGPGTMVVFESSIFQSPPGRLTGTKDHPALLIIKDSLFHYTDPNRDIRTNKFGYYKILDSLRAPFRPIPDIVKWPVK